MPSSTRRFIVWMMAVPLAWFFFLQARNAWFNYWLLNDGQSGMAVITKEHWGGHGRVIYSYVVDGKPDKGTSARDWKNGISGKVQPGENSPVYFSASHPWLSLLYKPRVVVEGWPVLIVAGLLEFLIVMAAINPGNKWGIDLSGRKKRNGS